MEVIFVLLESVESTTNDDSAHRMPQKAYSRHLRILRQLIINLISQSRSHIIDVTLSSSLIRRRTVHSHPKIIISFQLDLNLLHIESTCSQTVYHNDQQLFWSFDFDFGLGLSKLLEKYRTLTSEKSLVHHRKRTTQHVSMLFEELFVLVT